MITVGMNYKVNAGKDEMFISVFSKVVQVMEKSPGHAETRLFRDVFDPNAFLIVSEWTDQDAFDAFIASDRFKNVTNWGKENVLAERPRHEVYGRRDAADPPSGCPAHRGER